MKNQTYYGVIYIITNLENGKKYIGQTTKNNPKDRWIQHTCSSRRTAISSAIKKYGKESFSFEIIHYAETLNELNLSEQIFIKTHNTLAPTGYNIKMGGANGGKWSEVAKEAIRISHNTPEYKASLSAILKKIYNTPEFKEKMSKVAYQRWKKLDRKKHSKAVKLGMATPESKALRSAITKNLMANPDIKQKQKASLKTYNSLPETYKARSKRMLEINSRPETQEKRRNSSKISHNTPEVIERHKIANKKARSKYIGFRWIKNGLISKQLKKDEVLPHGWEFGLIRL